MIFFDQPVGTGFSFTDEDGYLTNVTQTSKHMFKALVQFFKMFPWLQENDFYITGESYGGKYVPSLGYEIFEENESYKNEFQINLKVIFRLF
jgi:vitellogenic carboxypeptidase-like protein